MDPATIIARILQSIAVNVIMALIRGLWSATKNHPVTVAVSIVLTSTALGAYWLGYMPDLHIRSLF